VIYLLKLGRPFCVRFADERSLAAAATVIVVF
jgi:hypothetical protein